MGHALHPNPLAHPPREDKVSRHHVVGLRNRGINTVMVVTPLNRMRPDRLPWDWIIIRKGKDAISGINFFIYRPPCRTKGVPITKPLFIPFATLILPAKLAGIDAGVSLNTIRTVNGPVTAASWKAATTVWLPGRKRWIETTAGVSRSCVYCYSS